MKFIADQITIAPKDAAKAKELLDAMGAGAWTDDHVLARGVVGAELIQNEADLSFEYDLLAGAKELEIVTYSNGPNWIGDAHRVACIGMHIPYSELAYWREFFKARDIQIAQEMYTKEHTNPTIAGKRWYNYVIFNTYEILGVDIKLIVRNMIGG